jgi:hypothetical protein
MGTPSTFAIDNEKSGSDQLQLKLRGRAMPYRPFTLEGTMRAEFTWYPGNAVSTVQMLGAEEKSSSISGMWKDRFIKGSTDEGANVEPTGIALFNGVAVADVLDLSLKVERIRLAGQLLRVEWDNIVRSGILLRFRQTWQRIEDLEWEMEFQWISRGEKQSPPNLPSSNSPASFAKQIRSVVNSLATAVGLPTFEVVEAFSKTVNAALAEIQSATDQIESAVTNSVTSILSPGEASERTLAATDTLAFQASQIVTAVESFPPLFLINTSHREDLGYEDALVSDQYSRGIKQQAKSLQFQASEQADTLRASIRQEQLLASFVARAPTDLRDVSQKYYGTADQWRSLLTYNSFESSRVNVGQLVLVPKLNSADRRV